MTKRWVVLASMVLLAGCAATPAASPDALTITPIGSTERIPATLLKPPGDGPFPAVVMVHDCSGLGPRSGGSPKRWAAKLQARGYVVILPDSFGSRGYPDGVCTAPPGPDLRWTLPGRRAFDAYGALAYLRTLPFVDKSRIGLMGGSHGGSTTLVTLATLPDDPLRDEKRDGFAAAIALYPGCIARYGAWSVTRTNGNRGPAKDYNGTYEPVAPLLILTGEKDDWTPAEPCRVMSERSAAAGHDVAIVIYPDAHHAFDSAAPMRFVAERNNATNSSGKGATTGGNAGAWADAERRVNEFFDQRLKGARP